MATKIKVIGKPAGYDKDDYQFFKNEETGSLWKASVELRTARTSMLAQSDVETAPAELAIVVTVSPIDEAGKVLREGELPIILDSHTHTFTHTELSEENFDPTARILTIIAERIDAGEARLSGQDKIRDLVSNWHGKVKIKAGMITHDPAPQPDAAPIAVVAEGPGNAPQGDEATPAS